MSIVVLKINRKGQMKTRSKVGPFICDKKSQMKIRDGVRTFTCAKKAQMRTHSKVGAFIFDKKSQMKTRNRVRASICAKKAQMKMMETIGVLIVFLILLTFVMIFYIAMSRATAGKSSDEKANLKAIEISQYISYMPEFQCSSKNIIEENCFDVLKVQAFIDYTQGGDPNGQKAYGGTYFDLFKESTLVVKGVYPNEDMWVIYNRTSTKEFPDQKVSSIPISLYNPITDRYSFGILNVTVYS